MSLQVMVPGQTRQRVHRRPNFPMIGTIKPYGLYPLMIHPVLPGETLKSATTKITVVSQPIRNPLVGAWLETWLMYVKLTDLDRELGQMFVSDSFSSSGYTAAGSDARFFTASGQIKWAQLCLLRCHEAYFIDEGEDVLTNDSVPMIKMNNRSWYQNLMFEPADDPLDTSDVGGAAEQIRGWQMLQQMQMTELTYEKYLEQYGVQSMKLGIGDPEILRFSRSWARPVNHIDPTSGAPSSAWVWNDEIKAEKDKRFEEPGFLIQMIACRPKFYQQNVKYSLVGNLWGFSDWYPAYNLPNPAAGVRHIGTDDLVFAATINGSEAEVQCLYDHRDLLSHGEQFVNDLTNMPYEVPFASRMSLLAGKEKYDQRGEYPGVGDINDLFVEPTAESGKRLMYEGITQMVIAGQISDTTPR